MKKRTIALLMAVVMLFGATVGGTIAWLTAKTDPVVNTFTPSDIAITLTETPNDGDSWKAQLIPGKEYAKDPVVAVDRTKTNVDVYLFVKIEEANNPATYLEYEYVTSGWTELTAGSKIYWREVKATDTDISWNLLKDNKVTVRTSVTKGMLTANDFKNPTISFKAYAIQTLGFANAEAAWTEVSKLG